MIFLAIVAGAVFADPDLDNTSNISIQVGGLDAVLRGRKFLNFRTLPSRGGWHGWTVDIKK